MFPERGCVVIPFLNSLPIEPLRIHPCGAGFSKMHALPPSLFSLVFLLCVWPPFCVLLLLLGPPSPSLPWSSLLLLAPHLPPVLFFLSSSWALPMPLFCSLQNLRVHPEMNNTLATAGLIVRFLCLCLIDVKSSPRPSAHT